MAKDTGFAGPRGFFSGLGPSGPIQDLLPDDARCLKEGQRNASFSGSGWAFTSGMDLLPAVLEPLEPLYCFHPLFGGLMN